MVQEKVMISCSSDTPEWKVRIDTPLPISNTEKSAVLTKVGTPHLLPRKDKTVVKMATQLPSRQANKEGR